VAWQFRSTYSRSIPIVTRRYQLALILLVMTTQHALFTYTLRLADDLLVLSHRLGEWCGHGPLLEEDIALTNRALDHLGEARNLLTYAGQVEGKGRTEDAFAYLRSEREFTHTKLVEQPNDDYAYTIVRSFLFDCYHLPLAEAMQASKDEQLAAIAAKATKEARYHLKHSQDWLLRFGDGTEESHRRAQQALDALWTYTGELFSQDKVHDLVVQAGIAPSLTTIKVSFDRLVDAALESATLKRPADGFMASGGREGKHSEHLGRMLAEIQYLHRAHPGATW
jgi:ring-1,2-phenylacetyl-CoA epoxidase subunit PaaC